VKAPCDITLKNNSMFLGIDPGTSGGAALISEDAQKIVLMDFSKLTPHDIAEWLRVVIYEHPSTSALVEKVSSMPGQGVASTFKFGHKYGFILGTLTALSIPIEHVMPVVWQRGMGVTKRGKTESKTLYKKRLKSRAQELFPSQKLTLKTCDALLIAEYHRRTK
jgi:crossover junction endodeoxyribonuclease RuvC